MDPDHAPHLHAFGRFVLDSKQLTLTRSQDGNPTSVRVSAAEARLLHFFLTHAGSLHSKETLLTIGWDGRPVSASSLPVAIANLRRYLDTPEQEVVIRTLPRQGYLLMLSPAAMQAIPTPP
ncbi:winged helix-turn-helix domain-containing protein, partial [Aeromonas hydrophila]|uniref:winged helix-turn-helix domain-containing protein n=1 Tax=Aeromonas hydrophila TaxID=644 RepID=UPI002B05FAB9